MKLYHLNDYCRPELPLAVWPVQKAGINVLHRHDCTELAFITRGSGVCRINGVPYPVLRGDVYILMPEDTHAYEMAPSCTFYNILFRPELMEHEPSLANLRFARKLYRFEDGELEEEDRRFATIVEELKHRRPGYEAMTRSLFAGFLVKLMRMEAGGDRTAAGQAENVSKVLEYIADHLDRPLSLRELAKVANMSPSAFAKAFRRWTGSTVSDYTGSLRIRKARKLLLDRTLNVGEIAIRLGFYDTCHFSRVFRKRTGLSPREYRQL